MSEQKEVEREPLDFTCEYSSNLPKLLKKLNITIAFTSYQAGRLMLVRTDGDVLDVNYKSFPRPMGLCSTENSITLGTFTQVIEFKRHDELVPHLKQSLKPIEQDITAPRLHLKDSDKKEEDAKEFNEAQAYFQKMHEPLDSRIDSCYITRSSHHTGMINLHDIDWGNEGLWVVNSSFSCLCTLDQNYSFVPRWKPHFISDLAPEDRCHLNGMTLKDGVPAYVTTFSTSNEPGKWRQGEKMQGTVMDVAHNEIIIRDLFMPHSPRWHQDKLYFCNSGEGTFCAYDPHSGSQEVVKELQGFTRGVDFYGPLAFVGLSKIRKGNVLNSPPLTNKYDNTFSGIWIIDLRNNSEVGYIKFTGNVEQIYDITVLPDCNFPELLEPSNPRMRNHFCIPV